MKKLVATPGADRRVRVDRAVAESLAYAARRIPEITDSIEAIDNAMKWGYDWELGPFETWDALGFAETVDRMKKDGIALPAWVDKMRAGAATGFYADGAGRKVLGRRCAVTTRRARPTRARSRWEVMRKGGAPVLKNARRRGVGPRRRRARPDVQDQGELDRRRRHQDAPRRDRSRRAATSARWSSGTRASSSRVGANLFAVVMAAGAEAVGRPPRDGAAATSTRRSG